MQGGNDEQSDNNLRPGQSFTPGQTFASDPGPSSNPGVLDNETTTQPVSGPSDITWEASEYIHHQKDFMWFLGYAGVVILLMTVIYLLLRDIFAIVVLLLMAVAVGVAAARKPKIKRYSLSHSGLSIGSRNYGLDEFRSYSFVDEGGAHSVMFLPTKRFMPPVSVYFAPEDGDKISAVLDNTIAYEEHQPDFLDRLMRRVRF